MKLHLLTPIVLLSISLTIGTAPLCAQGGPPPGGKGPRGEMPAEMKKKMLERFDTNKDGTLDDTEKAAMEKERKEHRGRGPRGGGQGGPAGQGATDEQCGPDGQGEQGEPCGPPPSE